MTPTQEETEAAVRSKKTHARKKVATTLSKYMLQRLKMVLENRERRIKKTNINASRENHK